MKKEIIICDECGKQKGDVNHWFVIRTSDGTGDAVRGVSIMRVEDYEESESKGVGEVDSDLCGQACVIRAVQKWMDAQSKPQPLATQSSPPPEYRHKPQCAMTCSDGAEMCDCVPGSQIESKGFTFSHPVACAANFGGACDC